jgi:hypothetical protein
MMIQQHGALLGQKNRDQGKAKAQVCALLKCTKHDLLDRIKVTNFETKQ